MKNNLTFEESLTELENIVNKLESAELSLDESINAFEKAVALVKTANKKIENAEQKVKLLIKGDDDTVSDKPFETVFDET